MSCCGDKKNTNETRIERRERRKLERELVDVTSLERLIGKILPFLSKASETDLLCLECCEKHLAKASAFLMESKAKEYELNIFYAMGQMGLAENHAREYPELMEKIRQSRLALQRAGAIPDWKELIEVIKEYI